MRHVQISFFAISVFLAVPVLAWGGSSDNGKPNAHVVKHAFRQGELLVRFKDGVTHDQAASLLSKHGAANTRSFRTRGKLGHDRIAQWHHAKFPKNVDTKTIWERLSRDPQVDYVEPNYEISPALVPNDPEFQNLWGLNNSGQTQGVPDADIDAVEAWDTDTGSASPVVAIIDSGVDVIHEDLATNIWINSREVPGNGFDDDGNGYVDDAVGYDFRNRDPDPSDDNGHGTHVAGIVGAAGNNGKGVTGVSWNARLMALKFLSASGPGTITDAIDAILYAVDQGAKVLNNSWGLYSYSQALNDAVAASNSAGVLFVAGAGNNGTNNDVLPVYPAGFDIPNVLAVAATNHFDAKASFSNYGAVSVDLGAPGEGILSTYPGNAYVYMNGTSMATPYVAGAAALLLSKNGFLNGEEMRSILMNATDPVPALFGVTATGGRLNVASALNCNPNQLFIEIETPKQAFTFFKDEISALRVRAASGCGQRVIGATATVSFSDSSSLTLYDDGEHGDGAVSDGIYGNFWIPPSLGEVAVTFAVSHPTYGTASAVRTGRISPRVQYRHEPESYEWIDATGGAAHSLGDDGTATVPIGFNFNFYGVAHSNITISANGFMTFGPAMAASINTRVPDPQLPNDLIAPFWDDLDQTTGGQIYTMSDGVAPNRRFTVAWVNVPLYGGNNPVTFQATLYEGSNGIIFQYQDVESGTPAHDLGATATVGVEGPDGLDGTSSSFNQPLLTNGSARLFYPTQTSSEVAYRVTIDLASLQANSGYLAMDMIDGDGTNNNQTKIFQFSTNGAVVLDPMLVGDATGTLIPGPARVGDAQFMNSISQAAIFGSKLSFFLKVSTIGLFSPFPDTYAFYLLDQNQSPYRTTDPTGADALFVVEVEDVQPVPQVFSSVSAVATVETVGAPIAVVGGPYAGLVGDPIAFDGSASYDPEGAPLNYSWDFGDGASDAGVTPVHIYSSKGSYSVSLVVTDGALRSLPAITTVKISAVIADSGQDQAVYEGTEVHLDGTASRVAPGATPSYAWVQTSGPSVVLIGANTAQPFFSAPDVQSSAVLTFRLTVSAGGETSSDTVSITVLDMLSDSDADGLPDFWEYLHFGGLSAGPADDTDGDGLSNLIEYQQGLDPNQPEPVPPPPADLVVTAGSGDNVLTWPVVAGASGYNLYWSTTPGVTSATGTRIPNVSSPYFHAGLTNGQTYYYVITSYNNSGESAPSVERSATPNARTWGAPAPLNESSSASVAADGAGGAMAVWTQINGSSTDIVASRYLPGQGWRSPVVVEMSEQNVTNPLVGADGQGNAIAVWTQFDGRRYNLWTARYDSKTRAWSAPELLENNDGDYYADGTVTQPTLAVDKSGDALVAWIQEEVRWYPDQPGWGTRGATIVYARRYVAHQGWGPTRMIDSTGVVWSSTPSAAIRNGTGFVAWQRRDYTTKSTPSVYSIRAAHLSSTGSWGSAMQIDNNSGSEYVDLPDVGLDDAGNAIAVWEHNVPSGKSYVPTIRVNRFSAETRMWGTSMALSTESASAASVAVAPSGAAVVAWNEYIRTTKRIVVRQYVPDVGWGSATVLASAPTSMTRPLVAMTDGNIAALWRTETAAGSRVYDLYGSTYSTEAGWSVPISLETGVADAASERLAADLYGNLAVCWVQVTGGASRVWVRRYARADGSPEPNAVPVANAGEDQSVEIGTTVTLNGNASADTDGTIVSYKWTQFEGPAVTLSSPEDVISTLAVPDVAVDTILQFRLTVTDDKGWSSTDVVRITARPPDTTPPLTTASILLKRVKGYRHFTVTLTASEPATTYFRASGDVSIISGGSATTEWQVYTGPVELKKTVKKAGSILLEYYSVDSSENVESPPASSTM